MYLQKVMSKKKFEKRAGSGAGSVSQRYGSADPDLNLNVTDPEHCYEPVLRSDPT